MRRAAIAGVVLALTVGLVAAAGLRGASRTRASDLPAGLSDQDFWALIVQSSEPGGYFRNENITNLTSNEMGFQEVIPDLVSRTTPGGVYLGVGPEQNYTYIAALKSPLAVIFDVRRGNLDLQLMYKAIFEMAPDRAEFISRLFAKPRPAGLGAASTADELFAAYARVPASASLAAATLAAIDARLTTTHGLPLPADDLAGLKDVYETFVAAGFALRAAPTYADLMTADDGRGVERSFLATEDNFAFLKGLESKNLVVPIVGDFGGPKAIRAVGTYLKARHATVAAFYLSNVEQYLEQDGKLGAFCRNVASLPLDRGSTFIRTTTGRNGGFRSFGGFGGSFVSMLGSMADDTKDCAAAG